MTRMLFAGILLAIALPAVFAEAPCEDLAVLALANTEIASAQSVSVSTGINAELPLRDSSALPDFCRVSVVARPASGSEIGVEIWLPSGDDWNGKLLGTGNGGYSGDISYEAMAAGLRQGYAAAGSDTGHKGGDLKFAVGNPEKIDDWGYRAVHVMTETAKLVVRAYYERFADYSYFTGCSTGGHQALTEAQRFPADYDGIVAGDPGNNRVRLNIGFLWSWLAVNGDSAHPFPSIKLPLLNRAAIAACDADDGVKDGLISDPQSCRFDPGTLLCQGADAESCLTSGEVEAVRKVYDGARNPRTGEQIYAGWARGTEASGGERIGGWSGYFVGQPEPARTDFWRYWVFEDPTWAFRTFDFDRDVAYADEKLAAINAIDPDLEHYRKNGGKLLMYHGWADPVVPPTDSIQYYESVTRSMGGLASTQDFFRLFMAPGMGHCRGGSGPSVFDPLDALDKWVTQGIAPQRLTAAHMSGEGTDRTRPLCPYPLVAKWDGSGSIDDEASFVCASGF